MPKTKPLVQTQVLFGVGLAGEKLLHKHSNSEIAKRVGVSRQTVDNWMRKPERMTMEQASRLCKLWHCAMMIDADGTIKFLN